MADTLYRSRVIMIVAFLQQRSNQAEYISQKMELSVHIYQPTFLLPIPYGCVFRLEGIPSSNNVFRPCHFDRSYHLSVNTPTIITKTYSAFTSTFKHCFGLWTCQAVPTKSVGINRNILYISKYKQKDHCPKFNSFWSFQKSALHGLAITTKTTRTGCQRIFIA